MSQHGPVKFYNADRGYGMITLDDESEAFVHRSNIRGPRGWVVLNEGDEVGLDVVDGPKGREARNVSPWGSSE
jgi:cold shock protein